MWAPLTAVAGRAEAVTTVAELRATAMRRAERDMTNLLRTAPPGGGAGRMRCPDGCRAPPLHVRRSERG